MNIISEVIDELLASENKFRPAYFYALLRQRGEVNLNPARLCLTVDSVYPSVIGDAAGYIKSHIGGNVDMGKRGGENPYFYFSLEGDDAVKMLEFARMPAPQHEGIDGEKGYLKNYLSDYVKALLIGGGVLSVPSEEGERGYLAEIRMWDIDSAKAVCAALNRAGVTMELIERKSDCLISTRKGEEAYNLLVLAGATECALNLQNIMLEQDAKSLANRRSNFEMHNLQKSVDCAVEQIEAINYLKENSKLQEFSEEDIAILQYRVDNPTASAGDIAAALQVSKSKVFRRLQKAIDTAGKEKERQRIYGGTSEE